MLVMPGAHLCSWRENAAGVSFWERDKRGLNIRSLLLLLLLDLGGLRLDLSYIIPSENSIQKILFKFIETRKYVVKSRCNRSLLMMALVVAGRTTSGTYRHEPNWRKRRKSQ